MKTSEYKKIDREFSESFVTEKVSNIYYRIKTSFSDCVLEEVEPYLTPDYYAALSSQLEGMKSSKKLLFTERLTVLGCEIADIQHTENADFINLNLRVRIVEYYVDPKTNAYLSGNKNEEFRDVKAVISRPAGLTTVIPKGTNSMSCPFCGAPANINKTTRCDYCGSVINTDCFNWLVTQA